ncbi:MAG: 1-acyl-sn-glycerol-3-phosphate acyltransferase [Planctomycetota bacterium]|nr:MAG: 1-acyl-sn-glycerol-3-phosphate acyltransferase [Planctomycetota bacterium]
MRAQLGRRDVDRSLSRARRLWYELCRPVAATGLGLAFSVRRWWRGPVPAAGPLLVVANHQSYLDPPLVGLAVHNRPLRYVAREGLFRSRALGPLIRSLNAAPVAEGGRADVRSMRAVLEALQSGGAVLLFPEGTRTPDGSVQPFRKGVGLLLKRARCPVLPVGIAGAYEAWPRSSRLPRLGGPVHVVAGRTLQPDSLLARGAEAALEQLREVVVELHAEAKQRRALQCSVV